MSVLCIASLLAIFHFILFSLCFVVLVFVFVSVSLLLIALTVTVVYICLVDLNGVQQDINGRSHTHIWTHTHALTQQYSHNIFSVVQINWKPLNQFIYSVWNDRLFRRSDQGSWLFLFVYLMFFSFTIFLKCFLVGRGVNKTIVYLTQ